MIIFKDNEMQERYNRIADRDLEKIFYEFVGRCKREQILVLPVFSGENGLSVLRRYAMEKGYDLGKKIHVKKGMVVADINTIEFVIEPNIVVSRGWGYENGKKKKQWERMANPKLSCFGVEMCLLGWSKFSGVTCTEISGKLNEGIGIEEIISGRRKHNGGNTVMCNGISMPIREALKTSCIPYWNYANEMRGKKDTASCRQSVFDKLAELHKDEAQRGVMRHFNRTWLSVSEDDFAVIQSMAERQKITEQEMLHLLINASKNKGA